MCIRTKTSYVCGHIYRSASECHMVDCPKLKKVHYIKDDKCRTCRDSVPHRYGNDGDLIIAEHTSVRGRSSIRSQSLRKISPTSSTEEISPISTAATSPVDYDSGDRPSPWASSHPHDKKWHAPHRRLADEAWLSEHKERVSDLEERLTKTCIAIEDESSSVRTVGCHDRVFTAYELEDDDRDLLETPSKRATRAVRHNVDDSRSENLHFEEEQGQGFVGRYSLPDKVEPHLTSRNYMNFTHIHSLPYHGSGRYEASRSLPTSQRKRYVAGAKTDPCPLPRPSIIDHEFLPSPHAYTYNAYEHGINYYRSSNALFKPATSAALPFIPYRSHY